MARPVVRIAMIQAMLGLGALAVVARAAQLQLLEGARWRAEAEQSRKERVVLPARRGGIYDRNGTALAVTQEYFEVGIAPNELKDRDADARAVARALELPLSRVRKDIASKRWVPYPGPYNGHDVQDLRGRSGIYLYGQFRRQYPAGALALGVIGLLSPDSGEGASGIELALDPALTGEPGEAVVLRDPRGRTYESPSRLAREPVPGKDVFLTIDAELQDIVERALEDAMREYEAAGGDIVVLDPRTGELLAAASRHLDGGRIITSKPSFFTDPFEPGSTAKLFTAAALLDLGLVDSTERQSAEHGVWEMPVNSRGDTRKIHDAHAIDSSLTLAGAIQVSSNIVIGKFSQRLTAAQQFDALRDFGFGSPTGVEFPSESRGQLRFPNRWDGYSKANIAMGYEFNVTPIQLATAYGAIANDGILLTPTIVRQIRSPGGKVLYQHQPEPVRRAISPEVARVLRGYLVSVVARGGTAESAQLANYSLAGKTGTAIRFDGTRYQDGHYTASFASMLPAQHPTLVVIVKIDDPRGGRYYGGSTAAPLTRTILEEALASRGSAIDRVQMAAPDSLSPRRPGPATAPPEPEAPETRRVVLALPLDSAEIERPGARPVPNVAGANVRRAASTLHRRGFRVAVRGSGRVTHTTPAAGDSLGYGRTVTVWAE